MRANVRVCVGLLLTLLSCPVASAQDLVVSTACPESVKAGETITFSAYVPGLSPASKLTCNWTVSDNQITGGQGTCTITVATKAADAGKVITATVDVGGMERLMSSSASCSVAVRPGAVRYDAYSEINLEDERARLDGLANILQNDPLTTAFVIFYRGHILPGKALRRAQGIIGYLTNLRGLDAQRIKLIDGGYRPSTSFELWVVPPDSTPPAPSSIIPAPGRAGSRYQYDQYDYYFSSSRPSESEEEAVYGVFLSPQAQAARLGGYAAELKQTPNARGVITYYTARGDNSRRARNIALAELHYLTRKQGIPRSKITVVNGGRRQRRVINLSVILPRS